MLSVRRRKSLSRSLRTPLGFAVNCMQHLYLLLMHPRLTNYLEKKLAGVRKVDSKKVKILSLFEPADPVDTGGGAGAFYIWLAAQSVRKDNIGMFSRLVGIDDTWPRVTSELGDLTAYLDKLNADGKAYALLINAWDEWDRRRSKWVN